MTLIIFLLVLGVLIFSHELGHFLVAKGSGARVDEFGLGFPPRLFSFRRGETVYSLNLIPFGGFVKIYGEDGETLVNGAVDTTRALFNKSKWAQAAVLVAGVSFNILLAWFLLVTALSTTGLPMGQASVPSGYEISNPKLTIVSVSPNSPAAAAGLQAGDVIVSFRTRAEKLETLTPQTIQDFTAMRADQEVIVAYQRLEPGIKPVITEVGVKPILDLVPNRAAIGVGLETVGILKLPFLNSIWVGGQTLIGLIRSTAVGLFHFFVGLFSGQSGILAQVAGPVGLVSLAGSAAALGFSYLIFFTALISINLALLNLLPIPALDGGRLLFLLLEVLKGSPLKPNVARAFNLAGFVLLILLMVVVTYSDIVKLIR